ncbi:PREDICTED: claudin-8-like [Poecilia mexicana]|uniref:claudin-8-like n=1 Tax=Poecilia mexicana TaxID=48701 RepID=UPI00072DB8E9|nr:PREDICTED: claudin-8-like [Poecilia mexicana]
MIRGISEIAAMCVGAIGLIGASATTGLPMWKVTAFIGANIIVMETRWEGLWMNCYRQANIRMQCKVYDSLLYLPPDLQAARGLMCCSVALSGVGLLVALGGMKCISCFQGSKWAKTIILMVAGAMQFMACLCVFIPVSWTGHVIISDFYNPLLIDAERRELGEALYIGWVTGALLFASALLFICRRIPSEKGSFDVYPPLKLLNYRTEANSPAMTRYHPVSSIPSVQSNGHQSSLETNSLVGQQNLFPPQNVPQVITSNGALMNPTIVYTPGPPENASILYQRSMAHQSSVRSSHHPGNIYTPGNQTPTLYTTYTGNTPSSFQSSFHPVAQTPVFIAYKESMVHPESRSLSHNGVYI